MVTDCNAEGEHSQQPQRETLPPTQQCNAQQHNEGTRVLPAPQSHSIVPTHAHTHACAASRAEASGDQPRSHSGSARMQRVARENSAWWSFHTRSPPHRPGNAHKRTHCTQNTAPKHSPRSSLGYWGWYLLTC